MKYLTAAWAWVVKFYKLASNKVTTYIALATAGLSELLGSWDQSAAVFPHWLIQHKPHIISVAALLTVWSRIRRALGTPVTPDKPPNV